MNTGKGIMKISELAETAGVSKQTIHFYLREGLLLPPVQTSRNMAYYDSRHVEEIRLIKELQEERYLPLAVIKVILESRRAGEDFHLPDHLQMMEEIFVEAGDEKKERSLTLAEISDKTGLAKEVVVELDAGGLLTPTLVGGEKHYNSHDATIAQAVRRIMDLGLGIDDLGIFSQILDLFRIEARIAHDRIIHHGQGLKHPPLKDIDSAFMRLKVLLANKAKRELIMEHQQSDNKSQRGGGVV